MLKVLQVHNHLILTTNFIFSHFIPVIVINLFVPFIKSELNGIEGKKTLLSVC